MVNLPETSIDTRDPRSLMKAVLSSSQGPLVAGETFTSSAASPFSTGMYFWWVRVNADNPDARFRFSLLLENFDEDIPDEIPVNGPLPNVAVVRYEMFAAGDTKIIPIEGAFSRGTTSQYSIEHLSSSPAASANFFISIAFSIDYDDAAEQIIADFLGTI